MLCNRMKNSNGYLRYNTRLQIHFVIAGGHFVFLDTKDTYLLSFDSRDTSWKTWQVFTNLNYLCTHLANSPNRLHALIRALIYIFLSTLSMVLICQEHVYKKSTLRLLFSAKMQQ